jgi:hypothetical protein
MSVSPQELLRRISADLSDKSHESTLEPSDPRFRELMKVVEVDDRPDGPNEKGIFSLLDDEEELCDGMYTPPMRLSAEMGEIALPAQLSAPSVPGIAGTVRATPISAEFEVLFQKMASAMIVMNSSNEAETTLYLDNPSSVFFGSRITIREFSTAPKAFNIEIASGPRAIELIEAGKQDFLAGFQNGRFNFSVHRLDTHIQTDDRPVFHRRESEDHGEQKGGGER